VCFSGQNPHDASPPVTCFRTFTSQHSDGGRAGVAEAGLG